MAKVVGVTDGDTIKVLHDGELVKIRLANIDCPERKQDFGQRAKQFTSDYVFSKIVMVDDKGTDRYHRTIGEISPLNSSVDLNHALVASGLAWVYKRYCHDASFYALEATARSQHVGLWSAGSPVPPWEFRKYERSSRQLASHPYGYPLILR